MKDWDSLPVLATIIPGNPSMVPAARNAWFDEMNVQIKALALLPDGQATSLSAGPNGPTSLS